MKLDVQKGVGYALVALSACCFALMPIFARIAYDSGVDTTTLLLGRFLIGGIFLAFLAWVKRSPLPPKKSWPVLFLLGLVGYAGTSFCYFSALNHASASLVALLLYAYPALVILLGFVIAHENVSRNNLLALTCASGCCMLVIGLSGKGDWKGALPSPSLQPVCTRCTSSSAPGWWAQGLQWQAAPSLFSAPRYRTCA